MINHIYQLVSPKVFSVKYQDISFGDQVIVRPEYMAVCHADQRYYQGKRDARTLRKKLPMALIHECCGRVVYDPRGVLQPGQSVILVPNVPGDCPGPVYPNYVEDAHFLSSGYDGFMQELVPIDPIQVIPYRDVPPHVAAITEFVSVAVHAVERFDRTAHEIRRKIGIWGDGSLAFALANVLHVQFPQYEIAVIGHQRRKLAQFSFVKETYLSQDLPEDFRVDHAFECCGGEGSYYAFEDVIRCCNPQGTLVMMGVSENRVAINTRMILEKGLTFTGSSRSSGRDFEKAVQLMKRPDICKRLSTIISLDDPVKTIGDLHRVMENDLRTPFKTVFKWEL